MKECKYCCNVEVGRILIGDGYSSEIHVEYGNIVIGFSDYDVDYDEFEWTTENFKINFCPMCGRDLKGE